MVGKYKVITLCGSTKFKDVFMAAQKQLTLEGNIVKGGTFMMDYAIKPKRLSDDTRVV